MSHELRELRDNLEDITITADPKGELFVEVNGESDNGNDGVSFDFPLVYEGKPTITLTEAGLKALQAGMRKSVSEYLYFRSIETVEFSDNKPDCEDCRAACGDCPFAYGYGEEEEALARYGREALQEKEDRMWAAARKEKEAWQREQDELEKAREERRYEQESFAEYEAYMEGASPSTTNIAGTCGTSGSLGTAATSLLAGTLGTSGDMIGACS